MIYRPSCFPAGAKPWKAILFDLDGTLIDSEPNYRKADQLFLEQYGISFPDEVWPQFVGMGSRAFIELMIAEHGMKGPLDALMAEKDSYYRTIARQGTIAFAGMVELNRMAHRAGLKTAVASGSSPDAIRESLESAGLAGEFDLLLSASQVARSKPFPDVFLEAAEILGVAPSTCLVVEDSIPGAQAGINAAMAVLAVPYEDSHRAHEVFSTVPFLLETNAYGFDPEAFVAMARGAELWPRG